MTAAVVHFDGDPVVINAWLKVYDIWRGEVDKVYCNCYFTPETEIILTELFANYSEITVNYLTNKQLPETTNNQLLPKIEEEFVMLTEEDTFIFEKGFVASCFEQLHTMDIVAPEYAILPPTAWEEYGRGWMRSMFFIKNSLLNQIEIDFLPRKSEYGDLDCFGYVCLQLAKLKPDVIF